MPSRLSVLTMLLAISSIALPTHAQSFDVPTSDELPSSSGIRGPPRPASSQSLSPSVSSGRPKSPESPSSVQPSGSSGIKPGITEISSQGATGSRTSVRVDASATPLSSVSSLFQALIQASVLSQLLYPV